MVGLLAVTQTVGYGVLLYSFPVFLTPTAAALHTSRTTVTGALTASLLAGAVAAVPVGRWLDRHGGRALMTAGSATATLLALAWSRAESIAALYAVWIALGAVSVAVLYETALPVIVSWFDAARSKALLVVTAVAGLSSSAFVPLAGMLNGICGWRNAIAILAIGHGVITVPLHACIRRPPAPLRDPSATAAERAAIAAHATEGEKAIRRAVRDTVFWLLAAAFAAQTCAVSAISVLLVAMLRELGHGPGFAATAAGLLGVLSVTGRLATAAAARRFSTATVTSGVFVVQAAGAALLPDAGHGALGAVACVLAFGLGFGVATIAKPALLINRYGTAHHAALSATWGIPLTLVRAIAPLGAALLWHTAGLTATLDAVASCCLLGAIGLVLSGTARSGPPTQGRNGSEGGHKRQTRAHGVDSADPAPDPKYGQWS